MPRRRLRDRRRMLVQAYYILTLQYVISFLRWLMLWGVVRYKHLYYGDGKNILIYNTPGSGTAKLFLDNGGPGQHPLSHGKCYAIDWMDKVVV